jgi:hypothetical protein
LKESSENVGVSRRKAEGAVRRNVERKRILGTNVANRGDWIGCLSPGENTNRTLKCSFRPWTLALVGLAIAVALWGYGYKISPYNLHLDAASRASFAD